MRAAQGEVYGTSPQSVFAIGSGSSLHYRPRRGWHRRPIIRRGRHEFWSAFLPVVPRPWPRALLLNGSRIVWVSNSLLRTGQELATNIATEAVVFAPADGYTLLLTSANNFINAAVYEKLSFDFVHDITMVAGIIRPPLVLEVNPAVPVKSVPELIAYAKANPGIARLTGFRSRRSATGGRSSRPSHNSRRARCSISVLADEMSPVSERYGEAEPRRNKRARNGRLLFGTKFPDDA